MTENINQSELFFGIKIFKKYNAIKNYKKIKRFIYENLRITMIITNI